MRQPPYTYGFKALAVARAKEIGIKPAARELDLHHSTVYRWVYPDYDVRQRAVSLAAKHRRKQPCIRGCGNLVSYDSTSGICNACHIEEHRATEHGTLGMYSLGCRCDLCRAANAETHNRYLRRAHKLCPMCDTEILDKSLGCRKHGPQIRRLLRKGVEPVIVRQHTS